MIETPPPQCLMNFTNDKRKCFSEVFLSLSAYIFFNVVEQSYND